MHIGPDNLLYMVQQDGRDLWRYNLDGTNPVEVWQGSAATIGYPNGGDFGPDGKFYISYSGSGAGVRSLDLTTNTLSDFIVSTGVPTGVTWGADGQFYMCEGTNLKVYSAAGALVKTYALAGSANRLAFAPDGDLYLAPTAASSWRG